MSKKSKRQVRKQRSTPAAFPTTETTTAKTSSFDPDYSYIIKDLRRIGILAGSFVGLLIILSFFLR